MPVFGFSRCPISVTMGETGTHWHDQMSRRASVCAAVGGMATRSLGENAQKEIGQRIQKACLRKFFSKGEQENGQ